MMPRSAALTPHGSHQDVEPGWGQAHPFFYSGASRSASGAVSELLETELNRNALASTVQHDLFDGNPSGWKAYVAHRQKTSNPSCEYNGRSHRRLAQAFSHQSLP
jgi:hypothetical protein